MSDFLLELGVFVIMLTLGSVLLGRFIFRVFNGERTVIGVVTSPLVSLLKRIAGREAAIEMSWQRYAVSFLLFNLVGLIALYLLQRLQHLLPFNPEGMKAIMPDSAFNTAVSFASNTNWQGYGGESTMSYLTQILGLNVQNFLSAASGIAVLFALIRGFTRVESETIGNFWDDLIKSTVCILLPLSVVIAVFLVSQGVVETFAGYTTAKTLDGARSQIIAVGPAASQVAIKQLGTNGGGFFNTNSAHPLENPTVASNLVQLLSILIIPGALCFTFGRSIGRQGEGWVLYSAMMITFLLFVTAGYIFERGGNPALPETVDQLTSSENPGGNMEGKEVRFGVRDSIIWAAATTAASNGSVNSMHDSYLPLSGLVPLVLMQLGEVIFGGVGSGLYGMIAFVIVSVFVAGLMVGRTPEYLGKKIAAFEIKMVSIVVLVPCALPILGTAAGLVWPGADSSISNPGPHGLTQILYAYASMGNNNGSAFAGFGANVPFHNIAGGIAMFISRYWIAVPITALAGSLALKKRTPVSEGTLPTDTPLFVVLLVSVVLIVGALTHLPSLALGPIAEHLQLYMR